MSAILSVDDLNDFISPGVACIKPIETLPAAREQEQGQHETGVILDGQQPQVGGAPAAQISLTDCLACSGCVTSAEAVLVSLQSHAEVLATLDAAPALRGRAAVCRERRMLERLLRTERWGLAGGGRWRNGFTWVVDTDVAREAALVLGADEALGAPAAPGSGAPAPAPPVLSSACPGWVCYAEKTHPHVLPHLSRVKSPQALMGTLLKTTLSRKLGIPPSRIWHLAVMPCFDKKLEASREELTDEVWAASGLPGRGVRDVDCVITSREIIMLAESRGLNFFDIPCAEDDDTAGSLAEPAIPFPDARIHNFLFPARAARRVPRMAGSSGGLLHHILQCKAAQIPGSEIQATRGRNADVVEFVVAVDGEPVFKAARYYGFRNIQNLVRRLKPARPSRMPGGRPFGSARRPTGKSASLDYGYVEVMACPGGCTNGGGQLKADDLVVRGRKKSADKPGPQEQKEWLAEVDEAYFSGEEVDGAVKVNGNDDGARNSEDVVGGISHSYIHDTLAYWCEATGISIDRLAFTTYREVISDVGKGTGAENVVQLAGKVGGGW
ncbi:Iron hydrogenase [Metarhizium album ARSEF 1941]|uniref:Cytosolic Fe-S cluster assembly factor NAR1 n=1 Tax=Metarhizium album (strain ARSEF 1941) TaxID=1081103 RepID=A0A0B2X2T5_METAS|nr:Iron hydrogenase [Metarhizium album ARSEF 1941]KHO00063.1 Iron hydrogenase [Metarhizium album ARSEF 1941]